MKTACALPLKDCWVSLVVVLVLLAAVHQSAKAQTYSFNRTSISAGGNNPCGTSAGGDFNGDGNDDLAIPDKDSDDVEIVFGTGSGGFTSGTTLAKLQGAVLVQAADFNGDKCQDIAVFSDTLNNASIFLNDCKGNFTLASTLPGQGFSGFGMALADFNKDGQMDVALANNGTNTISIYLGNGDGTFNLFSSPGTGNNPFWITAGDFNKDGKQDLAVANLDDGTASILLGNGDGTFTLKSTVAVGSQPVIIVAADFNHDGKLDLAAANDVNVNPGTVTILLGSGDGTFTADGTAAVGNGPRWLTAGDVNGDGKMDLVSANNTTNDISVLLGNGDGTFKAAPGPTIGTAGANAFDTFSVALADVNHDGKLDLVATNSYENSISVYLGNGDGSFASGSDYATGDFPGAVTTADFNKDGKPDLAVGNEQDGTISVFLGDGKGNLTLTSTPSSGQNGSRGLVAGDFNEDGRQDLASANGNFAGNSVGILLGNGDGTFASAVTYSAGQAPGALGIADFNGDGHQDLAVVDKGSPSAVTLLLGNGDGTFTPGATLSGFTNAIAITVGDFNHDRKMDFAVADFIVGASNLYVYLGNGDGTFSIGSIIPFVSGDLYGVSSGDFNKDGKLDLAVSDYSRTTGANLASILLGNGNGTFQTAQDFTAPNVGAIFAGDFSGDKNLDVAVLNPYASVALLYGAGDGTLGTYENVAVTPGGTPVALATADFNKDGGLDLAVANDTVNTVTVLLNSALVAISPGSLNFGTQKVGTTSNPMTITLYNPSSATLRLTKFALGGTNAGDFAQTKTCRTTLAPGANCTVSITFSPKATGKRSAGLSIADSAKSSPQKVLFSGTGN